LGGALIKKLECLPWPRAGEKVRPRGLFLLTHNPAGRSSCSRENDLEGAQYQGGKHGGQAGLPKSTPPPAKTPQDKETEKVRDQKR
jgi:hypothetical protein